MGSIPASEIVTVNPGVLGAGGNPLSLNGVILSKNPLIPTLSAQSFSGPDAVSSFFGPASAEYALAQTYFLGFDNSTIKPSKLWFAPFADVARSAWLQSGSFAGVTLTQLQALTGVLVVTVDGTTKTSATINLSAASSFSNAATLIAAGFSGGSAPTCTWNAVNSTFTLTSPTTGPTSTITFATNTLSAGLLFTSATGAIISQGVAIDTPTTALNALKAFTQNWGAFMTLWEPDLTTKELFAAWTAAQNQRYAYIAWDTDAQAIVNGSTTNFGYIATVVNKYDGVAVFYNSAALAALELGVIASTNFNQLNGRITSAFKSQTGFTPTVTDQQIAANLLANGYSFYGSYATANSQFNFIYNGQMAGKWLWIDTFANQVYLNSQFQLALLTLLTNVTSIPYTQEGYSLVRSAMIDPITAALNFGAIRAGVVLSALQKAEVNQAAGLDAATIIQQQGYYLQILDPGATVRGQRGTPVINFWYTDGGAIQKITLASIDII